MILVGVGVGPTITALLGWPLASRVQIAYAGVSLLMVFLVLMFGVGSWSRYVPEDSDVVRPKPNRTSRQAGRSRSERDAQKG